MKAGRGSATMRHMSPLWKALLVSQALYLVFAIWHALATGALPPPFFYDASDTFMDFFNTNFWAFHEGRFEQWHSIYPIVVFAIGRWLGDARCAAGGPEGMRICDLPSIGYLFAAYGVGVGVAAALVRRKLRALGAWGGGRPPLVVALAMAFCMPGMFALERGNYIVLAFAGTALAELFGWTWVGALFLGFSVDIKQYLVVLWLVPLLKRRYGYLVISMAFALALNVLGLVLVPESHYGLLIHNMLGFANGTPDSYFEKIWYPTSLAAWWRGLNAQVVGTALESSPILIFARDLMDLAHAVSLAAVVVALFAVVRRGADLERGYLNLVLLLSLMALTDSLGGYSIILLLPYLSALFRRVGGGAVALLLFVLLSPLDFGFYPSHAFAFHSFISGNDVTYTEAVTLGAYIRPLAVLALLGITVWDLFFGRRRCGVGPRGEVVPRPANLTTPPNALDQGLTT